MRLAIKFKLYIPDSYEEAKHCQRSHREYLPPVNAPNRLKEKPIPINLPVHVIGNDLNPVPGIEQEIFVQGAPVNALDIEEAIFAEIEPVNAFGHNLNSAAEIDQNVLVNLNDEVSPSISENFQCGSMYIIREVIPQPLLDSSISGLYLGLGNQIK